MFKEMKSKKAGTAPRGRTVPRTIVIGAGAAGLMAAGIAASRGADVILFEKMAQPGRKIGISGKGRCNLTNSAELTDFLEEFGKNGRFLRQCFQQFFSQELLDFFKERGLATSLERGGRYFPASGRALDVVGLFKDWLREVGVQQQLSTPVDKIVVKDGAVQGIASNNKTFKATSVIVATGGRSYPRTGSSGDGYQLLRQIGHSITPLSPALVPLQISQPGVNRLAGLQLRNVAIRLFIDGRRKAQGFGEVDFYRGKLGGAAVLPLGELAAKALAQGKKVMLALDLKPALSASQLDLRLLRDLKKRGGEPLQSLLRGLLPKELVDHCILACALDPELDTSQMPAAVRKKLVVWLKDFRLPVEGVGGWEEAIVTAGGISLKEIDPQTMESRLVANLFIAGELLDLQAGTGGYNLQAAFSTGWLAGQSVPL